MKRLLLGSVAVGMYVLSISIVSAQAPAQGQGRAGGAAPQGAGRGQQQPEPTNLQVLPKEMTMPGAAVPSAFFKLLQ